MISINVIIFSNYMFCEVYRIHPEDSGGGRISAGYPADIRHPENGFRARISGGYPVDIRRISAGGISNFPHQDD